MTATIRSTAAGTMNLSFDDAGRSSAAGALTTLPDDAEAITRADPLVLCVPEETDSADATFPLLYAGSDDELTVELRPDSISRFRRRSSDLISTACWKRNSRSFSKARLMMSSNFAGRFGFSRTGASGARFMMASKITPDVSPRNGTEPVAISYNTMPNENRSVRESRVLPLTCSGDM